MKLEPQPFLFLLHKSGTILIAALWSLIILAIFSVALANIIFPEIRLAKFLEARLLSPIQARSAYWQAYFERDNDQTGDYDTLGELQKEKRNKLGNAEYAYVLIDEESKININTATPEIIARLPGLTEEMAKAIVESEFRPFSVKEGLLLVEGVDIPIFAQVKDLITVYTEGRININTASCDVLQILGLSENLSQIIIRYRQGDDRELGTEDDGIFKNRLSILQDLREFNPLTEEQEQNLLNLINGNFLCVKSKNFGISLQVEKDGKPMRSFNIVFEYQTGKIKYWQER